MKLFKHFLRVLEIILLTIGFTCALIAVLTFPIFLAHYNSNWFLLLYIPIIAFIIVLVIYKD